MYLCHMRKLLLLVIGCSAIISIQAQQLQVLDSLTQEPIPGVVVSNSTYTKGTQTNGLGSANIQELKQEAIVLRHQSYYSKTLSWAKLVKADFTIYLSENTLALPEVTVSAGRWEQKSTEIPNQLVPISAAEIAFNNPVSSADLVAQTGQVYVQKSQLGGGSPMIRGFAANSILLVVDGVRLNNAIYRGGNLQNIISFDTYSLEGVEVVLGPGSVLYGSDALGGVIDFHTQKPTLSLNNNLQLKGNFAVRYGTAANEKSLHADLMLSKKKWAGLSSITLSSIGDLRSGKRNLADYTSYMLRTEYVERVGSTDVVKVNDKPWYQLGSGYDQLNILQKIRFQPSEKIGLQYSYHLSTSTDIPRYDRLQERAENNGTTGPLKYAAWYYGPQFWQLHHLRADINGASKLYSQAKLTAGYQLYEESRHNRRFQNPTLRSQVEHVKMFTLNADFEKETKTKGTLHYGLEGVFNWVDSRASNLSIESGEVEAAGSRYADQGNTTQSLAAYTAYYNKLRENLNLNSGLRYTYYRLQSKFSQAFYAVPFNTINIETGALSGNIGLTYTPQNWKHSLLFSTGFRAPNIDDIAKFFDPAPGTVIVPNPDLAPEYVYNIEYSIGYTKPALYQVKLGGFGMLLNNAIVQRPFTFNGSNTLTYQGSTYNTVALVNASKAYIAGANAEIRFKLSRAIKLNSALTYSWGQEADTQERLRHIPPVFGRTEIQYQKTAWTAEFSLDYQGGISFERLAPSEQEKSYLYSPAGSLAWLSLNLKTEYRIKPYLTLQSGLENILDTHYRYYSSGISAPGRNFYLSLKANF